MNLIPSFSASFLNSNITKPDVPLVCAFISDDVAVVFAILSEIGEVHPLYVLVTFCHLVIVCLVVRGGIPFLLQTKDLLLHSLLQRWEIVEVHSESSKIFIIHHWGLSHTTGKDRYPRTMLSVISSQAFSVMKELSVITTVEPGAHPSASRKALV